MTTTRVQRSIKWLLWNTYQPKQTPPQSFPFPAAHFGEIPPFPVPEMFSSKYVVFNIQGLHVSPVLHDPCKAANTETKTSPLSFYFFLHLLWLGTAL